MSKHDELDARSIEPRDADKGIFNQKSLGPAPGAFAWQTETEAGRDYLDGINGNTIVGRVRETMSPSEYRAKYTPT